MNHTELIVTVDGWMKESAVTVILTMTPDMMNLHLRYVQIRLICPFLEIFCSNKGKHTTKKPISGIQLKILILQ